MTLFFGALIGTFGLLFIIVAGCWAVWRAYVVWAKGWGG